MQDLLDKPGWVWWRGVFLTPEAARVIGDIEDEETLDEIAERLQAAMEGW